jgi:hypothetical protein
MYDAAPQLYVCSAGDQIRRNQDDRRCAEDEDSDSNQRRGHGSNDHGAMRRPQKLIHYVHPMIIRATIAPHTPRLNPKASPSLMRFPRDGRIDRDHAPTLGRADAQMAR